MNRPTTRHLVLAGAALVGASTAATSAVSLYQLAELCGIPAPLAAALPIALDAGAGVAALVWITERGELRSWGRGIAVAALIGTLAGNGVQHAITSGLVPITLPLVLAVGACIPAMLWATVHLAALMVRPAEASKTGQRTPAKPRAPRPPTPVDPPVVVEESSVEEPGRFDPASIEEIMRAEGCSRRTAYRRLKSRREQVA